jgi:hypothetical protein
MWRVENSQARQLRHKVRSFFVLRPMHVVQIEHLQPLQSRQGFPACGAKALINMDCTHASWVRCGNNPHCLQVLMDAERSADTDVLSAGTACRQWVKLQKSIRHLGIRPIHLGIRSIFQLQHGQTAACGDCPHQIDTVHQLS